MVSVPEGAGPPTAVTRTTGVWPEQSACASTVFSKMHTLFVKCIIMELPRWDR